MVHSKYFCGYFILKFFFLYVASIICLASYNIFFQLHTRLSCTFTKFYAEKFGLKYLICKSIEIVFLSFIKKCLFLHIAGIKSNYGLFYVWKIYMYCAILSLRFVHLYLYRLIFI